MHFLRPEDIKTEPLTIQSRPLNHSYKDEDDFLKGKFQSYAPTHHNAVLLGTTIQVNNQLLINLCLMQVLLNLLVIKRGRNGVAMALATGSNTSGREQARLLGKRKLLRTVVRISVRI